MITANKYHKWAPLFIRIVTGFGFMAHGWAKISRATGGFEKLLSQSGVPFPHLGAIIAPYVEFFGGLAVLLGAFVVIAALPLIITMLVAMFWVQSDYGFSSVNTIGLNSLGPKFGPPGYEINLLYIGSLLSLMFSGAGKCSVDALRRDIHQKRIEVVRSRS
ncbi:MAG TPA: DoxX family protein [Arachidicoccus sp.]|nr:DoxX family protein [Arachidicoccus sp.]